jgi:hypothetical protein
LSIYTYPFLWGVFFLDEYMNKPTYRSICHSALLHRHITAIRDE